MSFSLLIGDALERLRELPDESVQCCVTSPPYWGLRDYGVEGQIGLEPTPRDFIDRLVLVFREVRRVLRRDGTCWVNMGDTYASAGNSGVRGENSTINGAAIREARGKLKTRVVGAKVKDKQGIPWRLAFALQDDGWWFRSDIVWNKPNPMPEAVRDRPTVAHEFVFLLSKASKYFYNAEEAREPVSGTANARMSASDGARAFTAKREGASDKRQHAYSDAEAAARLSTGKSATSKRMGREPGWRLREGRGRSVSTGGMGSAIDTRNWRDVWTIPTQPNPDEHFAGFPEELARRCIIAGSRAGDVVLDPFTGTGTTGAVALKEGRRFVGVELNPEYAAMAERRSRTVTPSLFIIGGAA